MSRRPRRSPLLPSPPLFRSVLAVCLLAPVGAQLRTVPPYRILVTNDDGVHAPGIAAIAQILQAIGDVTIVAPSQNQSGKGHSIDRKSTRLNSSHANISYAVF